MSSHVCGEWLVVVIALGEWEYGGDFQGCGDGWVLMDDGDDAGGGSNDNKNINRCTNIPY